MNTKYDTINKTRGVLLTIATGVLLTIASSISSNGQSANGFKTVVHNLPYGLTWTDNDSITKAKLSGSEEIVVLDSVTMDKSRILIVKGSTYDRFQAAEMMISYDTNRNITATRWRFTGTRILTPIGIYDFLYPALKDHLGNPTSTPDSARALTEIRKANSDRKVFKALKGGEHDLFAQWIVTVNRKKYMVDLRVENQTGDALFTIAQAKDSLESAPVVLVEESVKQQSEEVELEVLTESSTGQEKLNLDDETSTPQQ